MIRLTNSQDRYRTAFQRWTSPKNLTGTRECNKASSTLLSSEYLDTRILGLFLGENLSN